MVFASCVRDPGGGAALRQPGERWGRRHFVLRPSRGWKGCCRPDVIHRHRRGRVLGRHRTKGRSTIHACLDGDTTGRWYLHGMHWKTAEIPVWAFSRHLCKHQDWSGLEWNSAVFVYLGFSVTRRLGHGCGGEKRGNDRFLNVLCNAALRRGLFAINTSYSSSTVLLVLIIISAHY